MAAAAVAGYWTLERSEKASGAVKRAGQAVGWVLVVGGLAGFVCASVSHAGKMLCRACPVGGRFCAVQTPAGMDLPPGHPAIGEAPQVPEKGRNKK